MTRPLAIALAVAAGALAFAGGAAAQGEPPALTWEPVGLDSFRVHHLVFAPGPAPDGSLDTLYTGDLIRPDVTDPGRDDRNGPHRLPPGGRWTTDLCVTAGGAGCFPRVFGRSARGTLLLGAESGIPGIKRSTDAGRTWHVDWDIDHVHCLYGASAAFGHDVFACEDNGPVLRSPDGAPGTWAPGALLDPDEPSLHALSLTEAPPGPALPGPRLVAAAIGGIAYSDDGARTWVRSSMWQNFRYWVDGGVAVHAIEGHPYGGVLYAGVQDYGLGVPTVYASEDGGATWALRATGPDMAAFRFHRAAVATDDAGGVWAATSRRSGIDFTEGTVLWSGDGARTWTDVGAGLPGVSVNALAFGRDGRLYAGTDAGVWRTAYAVTAEGGPEAPATGGLALSVAPNPAGGAATVEVVGLGAEPVRVAVFDAVGREVAVVWDGPARDGHRVAVATAGWPAGFYVVRAIGEDGASATARLTVAR